MALLPTTWNPFRQFSRFDPLAELEDTFRGFGRYPMSRQYREALEMRMDVTEDDNAYTIRIDMPGVRKEDIDVSVEGNTITVSAEVAHEKSRENQKELYSERFSGKAYRSFSLPSEVDSQKSEATYDGGVLSLTLPKKVSGSSRHLSIN